MIRRPRIIDDGGPLVTVIEEYDDQGGLAKGPQLLHVRVGPVFDGDQQRREPGVWIEYEDSSRDWHGPLLLDEPTWRALDKAVTRRLRRWRIRRFVRAAQQQPKLFRL